MGLLVNGQWSDQWYDTKKSQGTFEREAAQLRNWITVDGRAGSSGASGFKAAPKRYHLYVSHACPWAHRTMIFRKLKQLEDIISVSLVSPDMLDQGWFFNNENDESGDHLFGYKYLHQVYTRNKKDYTGRVTVPLLWDKQNNCVVSNESSEIIRMFNSAFNHITNDHENFFPKEKQAAIEEINTLVYNNINNGVYRCGFATTQAAYAEAYKDLFSALDKVENILSKQRYLIGATITEADWRLFTTLIRFDAVYHGHFKCNRQRLEDFNHIKNYVRELYQWPGISSTVNFTHIKRHYYYSHTTINPTRIVPLGPNIDYNHSHNRSNMKSLIPS